MSRIQVFAADFLVIGAGLVWAFIAGAEAIVIARDGWPPAPIGVSLMFAPAFGIAAEFVLVGLGAAGRFRSAVALSLLSLLCAVVLFGLQFSSHFIGYR